MKRVFTTFGTILAVLMAGARFSALPANADTGCPTPSAPSLVGGFYQIGTPANLQWPRASTAAADFSNAYELRTNINMVGCTWSGPIGSSGIIFSGSLDGADFKISNLTATSTTSAQNGGLLYQLSGSVTNLTLETPSVSAKNAYSGALAGQVLDGGTITNVTVTLA